MQGGGGIRLSVSGRPAFKPRDYAAKEGRESEGQEFPKEKSGGVVSKILDRLISSCFLLLAFLLPLFATNLTLQGIAFEKQLYFYALLLLILVSWTAKGVVEGELRIRRTPLDIPILIFFVLYAIAASFSVDRWHSVWGFFGDPSRGFLFVTAATLFYYAFLSEFTTKRVNLMLWGLVFSNAAVALWTLLALSGIKFLPEKVLSFAPVSLLGSVSSLAFYAMLMIPILMALIFQTGKDGKSFLSGFARSVALFFLILADLAIVWALYDFTRDLRLALLFGASMLLIYVLAKVVRPANSWGWVAPFFFIAVLALLMIGSPAKWLLKINLPVEVSPNTALSWDIARKSLAENPLLGSGPATYGYAFSKFKPAEFNLNPLYSLRFYQGTGGIFELLTTMGTLGAAVAVLLAASFASVVFYLLSRAPEKNKILSLGLATAALMAVVAFFLSRLEGPLLILSLIIGTLSLGVLLKESASQDKYWMLSLKASPKYALALAFVFMFVSAGVVFLFVFIGKAYLADALAGKGARQVQVREDTSVGYIGKSIALFPYEGRYYTRLAQEFMVLANAEFLKKEGERDAATIARYLKASVELSSLAKQKMPNDVQAVEVSAQVYENAVFYEPQALDLARASYENAKSLEPANPLYWVKLGQIEATEAVRKEGAGPTKKLELARDSYLKAIELKKDYALAHYYVATSFDELKDQGRAVEHAAKAYLLERANPAYALTASQLLKKRGEEGDKDAALRVLEDSLRYNEKNSSIRIALGLSYEAVKKREEAVLQYQAVLENIPAENNQLREQVEKLISNVRQGIDNNEYLARGNQGVNVIPESAPSESAVQTPPADNAPNQAPTIEEASIPQP